jgi:hypothetical protein
MEITAQATNEAGRHGGALRASLLALPAIALLALGCEFVVTCPTGIAPGLELDVRSAATGRPAWFGIRGTVRDGDYVDSVLNAVGEPDTSQATLIPAAWGRAGVYDVHLERPGFSPWDTARVTVSRSGGSCPAIRTVRVVARLQPAP